MKRLMFIVLILLAIFFTGCQEPGGVETSEEPEFIGISESDYSLIDGLELGTVDLVEDGTVYLSTSRADEIYQIIEKRGGIRICHTITKTVTTCYYWDGEYSCNDRQVEYDVCAWCYNCPPQPQLYEY